MTNDLHEKLVNELSYTKETGIFVWKATHRKGYEAGAIQKDGYIRIKFNGKLHQAHRLAWFYVYGEWPSRIIDHINRIKSDNRIENLRDVSMRVNSLNAIKKLSSSGTIGVYVKSSGYEVRVNILGKSHYLGIYKNIEDAFIRRYHKVKSVPDIYNSPTFLNIFDLIL
jgi:hypothetical protein